MTASARRAVFGLMLVPVLTIAPCLPTFAHAALRTALEDQPSGTSQVPVVGNAPAVEPQHLVVVLTLGEASAEALASAVSDPASPQHRRYLSSAAWRSGFAPTDACVSAMRDGPTSREVSIGSIPANRRNSPFSGTTAPSEAAFAIERGWGIGNCVTTGGAWGPNQPCPLPKCRPPQTPPAFQHGGGTSRLVHPPAHQRNVVP